MSRRAALSLLMVLGVSILAGCGSDPKGPDPEFTPVENIEVGPEGGVVDAGVIDLEVPEGALDGVALVSLTDVDPEVEEDLIGAFSIENYPVSLEIAGAALLDTAYILLPDFEGDPEFTTLGFKAGGEWQPLEYEQTPEGIRVPVSPEDIDLRDRGYGGDFVQALLHINEDPILENWGDYRPGEPVILFVHGILSDSSTWDEEILEFVEDQYGDVWLLTYPWHKLMQLVDDEIIDLLTDRLGDRDIVIVAHSKGGVQSRVIMRQMEDHNLQIRKALFLATPHYGSLGVRIPIGEVLARALYPESWQLIAPLIQGLPGVLELLPGSPSLLLLNTPHNYEQSPHYKCVSGSSDGDSDGVVTLTSANIAHSSHEGRRESAILHTGFVTELSHQEFTKRESFHHWVGPAHFLEWDESIDVGDFVLIEAGTFQMGSPGNELGRDDDEFLHWVTLTRDFYIHSTEVTYLQYRDMLQWAFDRNYCVVVEDGDWARVVDNLGSGNGLISLGPWGISFSNGEFMVDADKEDFPVTHMNWFGAASYCDWLSLKADLPPAYDHDDWNWKCNGGDPYNAMGYRLPTEVEWEYACRAGGTAAFANGPITFTDCNPLDPVLDQIGWYCGNADAWDSHAVAELIHNAWGLYDMHGNLYEYCNDWYQSDYYLTGPDTDPVGPISGFSRVSRSGGMSSPAERCRSASRTRHGPGQSGINLGFRPARSTY